jgi:hypothetical protein
MAAVVIGPVGGDVVVPGGVCVKTGARTPQYVIMRGSTTPGWVSFMILFTFIGWLWASSMASRRFRVEVAFLHEAYDRWNRIRRIAWIIGSLGVMLACWTSVADIPHAAAFLSLTAGGLVLGVGNALLNTVGFVQRGDLLMMTRVHPDAVAAIRAGQAEVRRVSHPGAEAGSA